jgi:hypothetical protein
VEYTTISQAALEIGADEEPTEQSSLPVMDDDMEIDNDIDNDNHDDDVPLRFRNIDDILRTVGFAPCKLVAEKLHVVSFDEPASFAEV